MVENSIRKFASENLSDDYIPVVHGQTRSLKPLILMVKQKRDLWKLPFAETELRILAGLGEYVTEGKKEEFEEITASTFKSEKVEIEREEEETAFSSFDTECEDTDNSDEVDIKLEDDIGILHLGHLFEEYHLDEDLPDILSKAVLDANGIKTLEENENCLLVSSVIYSERFQLGSSSCIENETRQTDQQEELSQFVSLLGKHAEAAGDFTMDNTVSGPSVPTRNTPGAFLFRVCEVYYDKGTGFLKIHGTASEATSGHRDFETHHDNYHKYVVNSGEKEKDVTPCTTEDKKRMENLKKLLMTVDTTEQRKRIVRQYLDWFKTVLTSEQKKVTLETPLTDGDCNFLRLLYIPAVTGQKELNWQSLSDRREIHRYGVLFKRLFDFTDKAWEELRNILDAGR